MYFCTPKALYNHVGGAHLNLHQLVEDEEAAAHPWIPWLVRKLKDPPMRSVRAAGIPRLALPKAVVPVPEPAPFRESTESAPEPAPFREPTGSSPEPAPFREPTESRARSFPGAHRVCPRARSVPGAHRIHSRNRFSQVVVICSTLVASCSAGPALASCSACPALAPLSAYSSGPSSTPRAWPTVPNPDPPPAHPPSRYIYVFVCGASGIHSLKGGGGGGALYVQYMACCLLLVPCALLCIVCPLPSCYPIIVSVVPPVSLSLPSFVSLFILLVSVDLC